MTSQTNDIDNEIRLLKEKKKRLEEITSKLNNIKDISSSSKEVQSTKESSRRGTLPKDFVSAKSTPSDPATSNPQHANTSEKTSEQHDEDRLALTKQEILDFCDQVISRWNDDPSKNSRHILAMNAVKTSVLWTEEETLKEIWKEILHWAFELLYKNAIAQAKEENLEWSKIMEKIGRN